METEIKFASILRQTFNFIKNRFWSIIIVQLFLTIILNYLPSYGEDMSALKEMSMLLANPNAARIHGIGSFPIFSLLLITALSFLSLLINIATIYNLSHSPSLNFKILIERIINNIPKLLLFFICIFGVILVYSIFFILFAFLFVNLLSQGLTFSILLLITLFALIFFQIMQNFMMASLVEPTKDSFSLLFNNAYNLTKKYFKLGLGIILLSGIFNILVGLYFKTLPVNEFSLILVSFVLTMVNFFILCFFYRLYNLIQAQSKEIKHLKETL